MTGTLHENPVYTFDNLAQFFLEWEIFRTKFVENNKTHILSYKTFFFSKIVLFA